jgi:geranylgeranyl diphosphate synthase, type II
MTQTLQVACTAGAILGGASPNDVANMEQFSDAIGLAFQVADDILDCTQTTEQLGKTAGKVN